MIFEQMADMQHAFPAAGGVDERTAIRDRERHRFFDHQVLARREHFEPERGMRRGWSRKRDRVDFRSTKDGREITRDLNPGREDRGIGATLSRAVHDTRERTEPMEIANEVPPPTTATDGRDTR